MTTSTLARTGMRTGMRTASADHDHRAGTWTCENCRAETHAVRKRCTDCGTSRY